jgi:hypothetical protein
MAENWNIVNETTPVDEESVRSRYGTCIILSHSTLGICKNRVYYRSLFLLIFFFFFLESVT